MIKLWLISRPLLHSMITLQSKRHIKRTKDNPGGIVSVESPLHYSNVSLVDPVTNAPIKVSWRYLEDGTKVRVTRGRLASQSVVPRPEMLKQRRRPPPVGAGPQDTGAVEFKVVSHTPGDLPSALKSMLEAETVKATAGAASAPPRFIQKKSALYRAPGAFRTFASSAYDFSDQWVTRSNLHPYPTEMWPYNILRPDLLRFYSMTER